MIRSFAFSDFTQMRDQLNLYIEREGVAVQTEKWQGTDLKGKPGSQMVELLHTSFGVPMVYDESSDYQEHIQPNLPWAEDHFQERVCGYAINPGVEWENWPWANKAQESMDENGQFNHNYMERYWPSETYPVNTASRVSTDISSHCSNPTMGLRHQYGDLEDLCELLAFEPTTRQAYMPIWFPEDTGTAHSGRKPCTLGYHFIVRNGSMDITYYIRSCDFIRHFQDDVYLTVRLGMYIINRCRELNHKVWNGIQLGDFNMHITSLHMFINDYTQRYGHRPLL